MHVAAEEKHNAVIARLNCFKRFCLDVKVVFNFAVINQQLSSLKRLWLPVKIINVGQFAGRQYRGLPLSLCSL
jgi:hypothetical protein